MSLNRIDKIEYYKALERKLELQEGLPFLHGWPWYKWAREFFESTQPQSFLVAANQISKSSTQIRKCIDWATDQKKWPRLWRSRPTQFWYFYPTKEVATIEFETKWVREFLPRGIFKDHPVYGWKQIYKSGDVHAIQFNSGVIVYFKSYEQGANKLQTATVYAIFADEEMPYELYPELNMRTQAVSGYFHMVFTATLGQDEWRQTMEPQGTEEELFKGAFKRQVSMWDCMHYEDGTPTHWDEEKIKRVEASCGTESERLRRVEGRFVKSEGLKYPSFNKSTNMGKPEMIPRDWNIYSGVDIGSGGEKAHPAAIVFVAVNPQFTKGRVFRGWRGDKIDTTAQDILAKHTELKTIGRNQKGEPITMKMTAQYYDWQSKDFFNISSRVNEPFTPADKARDRGEQIVNTLFKSKMLSIDEGEPELQKLVVELCSLSNVTPKTKAKDDFVDALRYAVTNIPWDWNSVVMQSEESDLKVELVDERSDMQKQIDERRAAFMETPEEQMSLEDEMDSFMELMDYD